MDWFLYDRDLRSVRHFQGLLKYIAMSNSMNISGKHLMDPKTGGRRAEQFSVTAHY